MASTIFRVSRTEQEGQPSGAATLNRAQDPLKIKIYDTKEDIDISDLAVNEVVATVEEEPLANIHITDTVEDGNMNPVTSNAVHDAIDAIVFPEHYVTTLDTAVVSGTEWDDTIQEGSRTKTFTLSESGWYRVMTRLENAYYKDNNELALCNSDQNKITYNSYGGTSFVTQSQIIPLAAGTYSWSHICSTSGVNGRGYCYLSKWSTT